MTRLLLDTTFLVDAERDDAIVDELIADDADAAMAAITLAELQVGVLLASPRRRPRRAALLQALRAVLPVISYEEEVAGIHAELLAHVRRSGRPRGAHDLIIAATARATGRVVVTSDRAAFDDLPGVELHLHR